MQKEPHMPNRRLARSLLLAALLLPLAGLVEAKPCKRLCRDDIASCRSDCNANESGKKARKRCRAACQKDFLATCRAEPEPVCHSTPCTDCNPGDPVVGFTSTVQLTSSGSSRTYSRFVPTDYDASRSYPVVFAFHGDGGTGSSIRDALGLETPAASNAIFVYPDATEDSGRSFDLETPRASNADMQLVVDILADLDGSYHVDHSRVFATGMSRGGYFVNFLNCRFGTALLRAIAAHSGSGPYGPDVEYDENGHLMCEATAAAALMIHGTADNVVPIDDGRYSRFEWLWHNQCSETTTPIAPSPCVQYDGCLAGKPVEWCEIPGLGHAVWSQAGTAIWSFFASFPAQ